ncbi:MAG: diguanylate cyclase [Alphaproteobacteria bacterium]|nr:diguanylate cyclase [Alphaproteobacteria bacterium]
MDRIKALLVEDNPGDAHLIRRALSIPPTGSGGARFDLTHVETMRDCLAWLAANHCDVVFLDLSLPDSSGFATINSVQNAAPALPVIVLTGLDDPEFAASAVESGMQEFLVKGSGLIEGDLLHRAARHAILRKQLEMRVRASESRLNAIITLAYDAFVVVDEQRRITLFNPAAERMFGWTADEVRNRPFDMLLPERTREDHARLFGQFLDGEADQRSLEGRPEIVGLRRTGDEFPAEVSLSRFRGPGGNVEVTAVVRDVTERKRTERELVRLATTDSLTGACNRRRFLELAETEVARLRRYGGEASVIMLDIDHFKKINDNWGHGVGDTALVALVELCRQSLREADVTGRVGGEEFAILLPNTGPEAALRLAQRLHERVRALLIPAEGGPVRFTVSLGVAVLDPDRGLTRSISMADKCLYEAKQTGRDRVIAERQSLEKAS